jgi:pyruvate formate lyase activating enzyme
MIREAMLYKAFDGGRAVCALCSHRCDLAPGKFGVCGVRENRGGRLMTHVYGQAIAAHVDPIEKKPFFHFWPGSTSFSIATVGCNFRCPFCQNWQISQAAKKGRAVERGEELSPEKIVRIALDRGCRSISYTYTEPTVFFEYAYDTAKLAHEAGLANNFVTNGFMTAEALETIRPYLDAANVDLKAFREETYEKVCRARLGPVLDSIRLMRRLDIWVEVTTLVVPGLNDSDAELGDIARFIAGVDPDMPWHISRFHPDYKYTEAGLTPVDTLRRAFAIGWRAGLRYVYIGNVSGESDVTYCPHCFRPLIQRRGFRVEMNRVREGACPDCRTPIAGIFHD